MSFRSIIDIDNGSFAMVFTYGTIELELWPLIPKPIESPIKNKGSIMFGCSQLCLMWDEGIFTFCCDSTDREEGAAFYLNIPMTPELMASFKAAVDEWNAKYAVSEGLRNIQNNQNNIEGVPTNYQK